MCTVSWARRPRGYTLFFNRDESRERPEGLPPEIESCEGIRFVCPRDPAGGGTWLLVNDHGLTLGLLNYYEAQLDYQPSGRRSRGQLPIQLATSRDLIEVEASLGAIDLAPYPPFHLLAVDRDTAARLVTWDGQSKSIHHPALEDLPITTSAFETAQVLESRRSLFRQKTLPEIESDHALLTFHSSREPVPDPHAVLMTRPDAKTVSVTQIKVEGSMATLIYRARPDDSDRLPRAITQSLELR